MPESTPRPQVENIIEVRDLKKTYVAGRITIEALRGVNMKVRRGEMVTVMGPSGCGKTTLLNCASGLDEPTSGHVKVDGVDVHRMSDDRRSEFRSRRMGFIFQAYNLLPVLSALENVELPLLITGVRESAARERATEALALVGLEKRQLLKPSELSGGEQQRVAIARSLANRPAIVWGDEPTGNLDTERSGEIMELLKRLNREIGLTLVLVTHDLAVANQTHRIFSMRDGMMEREMPVTGP